MDGSSTIQWAFTSRRRLLTIAGIIFILAFGATYLLAAGGGPLGDDETPTPPPTDPPNVTVTPPPNTTPTPPDDPPTTTPPTTSDDPPTTTPPSPPDSASLSLSGEETITVDSAIGDVDTLYGRLNGTLSWEGGSVDSVVFVVQTWTPDQGWTQTQRVTTEQQSPVTIAPVLDTPIRYVTESQASDFDNPQDGTTQSRYGSVAVTAVLFDDGVEQQRLRKQWNYTVSVTNYDTDDGSDGSTDEVEIGLDIGDSNNGSDDEGTDSGDAGLVNNSEVTPGDQYASTADLSNTGSETGEVFLNVSYTSFENGIVNDAERQVDSTGGDPGPGNGELHTEFEIRVAIVAENGSMRYVLGNESAYRELAAVTGDPVPLTNVQPGETADLRVEYRVDPAAGNEIQSDTLSLDFEFLLQQA